MSYRRAKGKEMGIMAFDLALIILWVGYTIIFFRLYHKIFKVYYLGSAIKGIAGELFTCFLLATFFTAITIWFWWLAAIILVLITLWMRGKCESPSMKTGLTVMMGAMIVLVAIAGVRLNKSMKVSDDIKESDSITDTGIFNTTEEQAAYLGEKEAQERAEEEYLENSKRHAIYCEGDTPVEAFEEIFTKKQVVETYGESEDIEDFYMGVYTEVYFRDLLGEYEIDYDLNGVITSAFWSCETTDIEYCTEVLNDLISYYQDQYGEYRKSEFENDNLTSYMWESGHSIVITIENNSIRFHVSPPEIDFYASKLEFLNLRCYEREDGFLITPHTDDISQCSLEFDYGDTVFSYIENCMLGGPDLLYYDGTSEYTSNSREYPGLMLEAEVKDSGEHMVIHQTGSIPNHPDVDLSGEYTLYSFEPEESETGFTEANEAASGEYILADSDFKYFTFEDLDGLSAEECSLARNEIYARHGRRFNDESLQDYFDSCSWYEGYIEPEDFTEDMLNDVELSNLRVISSYENYMGF